MSLKEVPFVLVELARESRDAVIAWRNDVRELVEKRRLDKLKTVIGEKPPQIELHSNAVSADKKTADKKKKKFKPEFKASGRESPLDNL